MLPGVRMQEYFYWAKKVVKLNGKNPFEAVNMQVASKLRKWEMESTVDLIFFGALGYNPKNFKNHQERIDIYLEAPTLQKSALLESANIFRKVLSVWGKSDWLDSR